MIFVVKTVFFYKYHRVKLSLPFFLLLLTSSLFAQWNVIEKWSNDWSYSLVERDGVLYGGCDRGLFRSTDKGHHWQRIDALSPISQAYDIAFTASGVLYVVTKFADYELKRSRDLGLTWETLSAPPGHTLIPSLSGGLVSAGEHLFMHNYTDLFRLHSDSSTWEVVQNTPFKGNCHNIYRFEDALWVAAQGNVCYKSTDEGKHWTEIQTVPSGNLSNIAVMGNVLLAYLDPVYFSIGLLRSADGGQTWTSERSPEPLQKIKVAAGYFWAFSHLKKLWRSADGITWESLEVPIEPATWSGVLEMDDLWLMTGADGFLRSTDAGQHWWGSNAGTGGQKGPVGHLGNTLVAGGKFFSSTHGDTWQTNVNPPTPFNHFYEADGAYFGLSEGNLWRCDGDFTRWELVVPMVPMGIHYSQGFWPAGQYLFSTNTLVTEDGKVYRSADKGLSWEVIHDFGARFTILGTLGDSTLFGVKAPYQQNIFFISKDLGQTWESFAKGAFDGSFNFVYKTLDKKIYNILTLPNQHPHLHVSSDYGETWNNLTDGILTPSQTGLYGFYDFAVSDSLIFAVSSHWQRYDHALWVSSDQGDTWANVIGDVPNTDFKITNLNATPEFVYFVNEFDGKIWLQQQRNISTGQQAGEVYWDYNRDSTRQVHEPSARYCGIASSRPGQNGVANENGLFRLLRAQTGDTIRPVPPLPFTVSVPAFALVSEDRQPLRFGLQRVPGVKDLRVEITPKADFLGGRLTDVQYTLNNDGTDTLSGIFEVIYSQNITLVKTEPDSFALNGQWVRWKFDSILPGEQRVFWATFKSATLTALPVAMIAKSPLMRDTTPLNNHDTLTT